ncbi:hypothetical protein P154DRAFT_618555 [Amniculicola lignicola CBS 123094]|uniref:Uncharacterized protein n=1 Tax=Amniculicola lignicola CBS 123094 TaxID=1392246 RepID=A0A6A5WTS9_9PLEO|nr:hypothetical protein P154DRAFT_618555 [Amniculicola lignicola CBS 123094]
MASRRRINLVWHFITYFFATTHPTMTYAQPIAQEPTPPGIPINVMSDPNGGYLSKIDPITLTTLVILLGLLLAVLAYWVHHHEKKKKAKAIEEARKMEEERRKADEEAERERDMRSVHGRDWSVPQSRKPSKLEKEGVAPHESFGEPPPRKFSQFSPNEPFSTPQPRKTSRVGKDLGSSNDQPGEPQSTKGSKQPGLETVPSSPPPDEVLLRKSSGPDKQGLAPSKQMGEPQSKRLSSVTEREEKDPRVTV